MLWFKRVVAVLLLPASAAVTLTTWELSRQLVPYSRAIVTPFAAAFCAGYTLWLVVFVFLPKPMRTYVLGHELTHAFWALVMGARVSGLRVRTTGGQVKTSKTNWFITLAPYFFPFYAMLFTVAFFVAHAILDLSRYMWVLFFLIGLGWSFHITFTLMMLLSVRQPDVRSQGAFFSFVVIYLMNLLAIVLTATALSPKLSCGSLATSMGRNLVASYGWSLDKLLALWQYATSKLR